MSPADGRKLSEFDGVQSPPCRNDEVIRMCHLISSIKLKQEILLTLDVLSEFRI